MRRSQIQQFTDVEPLPWDFFFPNFDKLILCASNLFFLAPVIVGLLQCRYWEALSVTAAGIASVVHHAVEERFGFPALVKVDSEKKRFLFLQADRFFAVVAMLVNYRWFIVETYWPHLLLLLALMLGSEAVVMNHSLNRRTKRISRAILHTAWHFGAFTFAAFVITFEYHCL